MVFKPSSRKGYATTGFVVAFLFVFIAGSTANTCGWLPPIAPGSAFKSPNAKNIVFFTDGANFDDFVCLNILLKSPEARLLAIVTQGNAWANVGPTFRTFLNTLHMYGINDVPVLGGSYFAMRDELDSPGFGTPVKLNYRIPIPSGSGGLVFSDTLWGLAHHLPQGPRAYNPLTDADEDFKALPALLSLLNARPNNERWTFFSSGTLTPIARLFTSPYSARIRPLLNRVDRVVVMGGAVNTSGNLFSKTSNVEAEFNMYNDPHAAQWAFSNLTANRVPITLVPLDATNDVPFQQHLLDTLSFSPATAEAQFMGKLMERLRATWFDPAAFFDTAFLWDPTSAIVALYPEVIVNQSLTKLKVVIDQGPDGPAQGDTAVCSQQDLRTSGLCSDVTVVYDVNGAAVTNKLLELMQSPLNSARVPLFCYA